MSPINPISSREETTQSLNTRAGKQVTSAKRPDTATAQPRVLSPAEWARQVLGITTPFGHDRLPTVLG